MRQRRDEDFRLVMNAAEKAALAALAEHDDGSQAAIVRKLVRDEAERQGLWGGSRLQVTDHETGVCL